MSERERVMAFARGGVRYAVEAGAVRGVVPFPDVTVVPGTDDAIRGAFAWRGAVVPLVEPGDKNHGGARAAVVVLSVGGLLGLAADEVVGWGFDESIPILEIDAVYHRLYDAVGLAAPQGDSIAG